VFLPKRNGLKTCSIFTADKGSL